MTNLAISLCFDDLGRKIKKTAAASLGHFASRFVLRRLSRLSLLRFKIYFTLTTLASVAPRLPHKKCTKSKANHFRNIT
jgi:hypothetical protein